MGIRRLQSGFALGVPAIRRQRNQLLVFSISGTSSDRRTIPATLRSRDFATAIMQRAIWELAALITIQSLGFGFTNSAQEKNCRRRIDI